MFRAKIISSFFTFVATCFVKRSFRQKLFIVCIYRSHVHCLQQFPRRWIRSVTLRWLKHFKVWIIFNDIIVTQSTEGGQDQWKSLTMWNMDYFANIPGDFQHIYNIALPGGRRLDHWVWLGKELPSPYWTGDRRYSEGSTISTSIPYWRNSTIRKWVFS